MGTKSSAFTSFNVDKPYRATKLWNEVVRAFRAELPRGCHKKRMKVFEDSFIASEAVDWLLNYLETSPHFGQDVQRQQATQLLQKFLQCDLIEALNVKKKNGKPVFEDNKQIYRIRKATPLKSPAPKCLKRMMRTPLSNLPVQQKVGVKPSPLNTFENCNSKMQRDATSADSAIPKQVELLYENENKSELHNKAVLSSTEVANIWKSVLWNKLSAIVAVQNMEEILNPEDIKGQTIVHNVTCVQKNGIASLIDKSDDVPNWIMCAMKCLTKWPYASGRSSCLPNYPGFEKDVFNVVKDYFITLEEPLIPYRFFGVISELYDNTNPQRSTGVKENPLGSRIPETADQQRALKRNELTFSDLHLHTDQELCIKTTSSSLSSDALLDLCKTRASYCFETAFSDENPLTRIIRRPVSLEQHHNQRIYVNCANLRSSREQLTNVVRPAPIVRNRAQETFHPRSRQRFVPQRNATVRCLSLDHLSGQTRRFHFERREKRRMGLNEAYFGKPFDPQDDGVVKNTQSASVDDISDGSSVVSSDSLQKFMVIRHPYTSTAEGERSRGKAPVRSRSVMGGSQCSARSVSLDRENSRSVSALSQATRISSDSIRTSCLPRSQRLVKCFQLLLLLIPLANRRKLHLLLRFLNKIIINRSLHIFPQEAIQSILVQMFWSVVLKAPSKGLEIEESLGCQVVQFLLDHCEAVLAPPVELKMEVESIITLLCQSRLRHSKELEAPESSHPVTFCEQMTNEMYEDQKANILHSSLMELLEEIINNPHLSSKERMKKLDKFKRQYPDVYKEKFPASGGLKLRRKKSLLDKFRNMRL